MQHDNIRTAHLLEHIIAQERRKYDMCYHDFDAAVNSNLTYYRAVSMPHNAQKTLETLYNIVHNAVLEERVFDNEKRSMNQEYDRHEDTFDMRIDESRHLYYYKDMLTDTTFDDVKSFYNDYYTDENIIIITCGGYRLDTSFMQYRSGKEAVYTPYNYMKETVKNMDIHNRRSDYLDQCIAFIGSKEYTKEFFIESVIMHIIAGYHNKSVYNILRFENGYTYFYDNYYRSGHSKTYYIVRYKTSNDTAKDALQKAIVYMDTVFERLTDNDIIALKDNYRDNDIMLTTPKTLVNDMCSMLSDGFNTVISSHWSSDIIDSITIDEIRETSKKLLDRNNIRAELELPMGMTMRDVIQ